MKFMKISLAIIIFSSTAISFPVLAKDETYGDIVKKELFKAGIGVVRQWAEKKALKMIDNYENKTIQTNQSSSLTSEYKQLEQTYNLTPKKIVELVSTWQYLKARNSKILSTEGYTEVLYGKALNDSVGAIDWLEKNNAYWEILGKDFWIDSLYDIDSSTAEVVFVIKENAKYYQNGKELKKQSYSNVYKAKYVIKDYGNGDLKIVTMSVIK